MLNKYTENNCICQKTISQLLKELNSGSITSEQIVWQYFRRIGKLDKFGSELNAMRELNPDAIELAKLRDYQRKNGVCIGSLHGIPIILKDCIDTADKMHTTCGAVIMKNHYADKDAFLVKLLRKAGAIILGKANLSEWYGFCSTKAPSGYSGIAGGSMKNPYGPDKFKPGGSSGGCAVAVSAGYAPAAIGTETSGSIIEPSYFCSVVGWKPTVGLISRTGVLPVMLCQDTPGTLTLSVEDAAILANVLVAKDEEDFGYWVAQEAEGTDFTDGLDKANIRGKKIGIAKTGYYDTLSCSAKAIFDNAVCALRNAGAVILEDIPDFLPSQLQAGISSHKPLTSKVMNQSFLVRFNEYLGHLGKDVPAHNIDELIAWNDAHKYSIPYGQDYLKYIASQKNPLLDSSFVEERYNDLEVCDYYGVGGALEKFNLDAIIFPGVAGQGIAPRAGNPIITIPAGYEENGAPVGLNLVGHKFKDHDLFKLAASCERVLSERIPPEINKI